MKKSTRLFLLALSAAIGIGAFQSAIQAAGSTALVTICYRGNTIQVPSYLQGRYLAIGGTYTGPCLVSSP